MMGLPAWAKAINPLTHHFVSYRHQTLGVRHFAFPDTVDTKASIAAGRDLLGPGWQHMERENMDFGKAPTQQQRDQWRADLPEWWRQEIWPKPSD